MKKNKTKKNTQRLSIEELCNGKQWSYIVESMPAGVQRLTISALEAFDKDNAVKMEQALSQIKEGDTRVLRLLLAALYEKKKFPEKAIVLLAQLIQEEGDIDKDMPIDPIPYVNMQNILDIPASIRVECYNRLLAIAYMLDSNQEALIDTMKENMPLKRKLYDVYGLYIVTLLEMEKYNEARDVSKETISFLTEGELGKDYFWYDLSISFGDENDRTAEYKQLIEDRKLLPWASHVISVYNGLLTSDVCLDDIKAYEDDLHKVIDFMRTLDKDILYSEKMKHLICDIIIDFSTSAMQEDRFMPPFKMLLDRISDTGYYGEDSPNNEHFLDLIPSGYRIVEHWELLRDSEFMILYIIDAYKMKRSIYYSHINND